MTTFSITRRLIVSLVVTELVLTAAVAGLATYLTRRQLRESLDAALHGRAMSVAALVRFSEDAKPRLVFDSELAPPPLERERRDLYAVLDSDSRIIAASPGWSKDFPSNPSRPRSYWTVGFQNDRYRVVRLNNIPVLDQEGPDKASSATITVIYAASTDELRERSWAIALFTGLGSLVILAISTAVTVWVVRRGLSPLAALTSSAASVTVQDWKLDTPDQARTTEELSPLVEAMDQMLLRLQQAFNSQREFVANAAHEMKTPIAVLKSTLQLSLQRPRTTEEYRAQLETALDDVARLEALTHSMLRLARAEQLQARANRDSLPMVDLTVSCEQSIERLRSLAETKSVRIGIKVGSSPELRADPDDLELIWNNLLDNAIRFSPSDSTVTVTITNGNGAARVDVSDSGPGIPESDLRDIFDRFHRSDPSRSRETGGYGLGLAIAKAMAESYGGTIAAESHPGSGTTMSVRLPVSS